MTRRAVIRQADVSRIVRGAISGGLPAGSFIVEVVDNAVRLLPTTPGVALPSADSAAEAEWDKALGLQ